MRAAGRLDGPRFGFAGAFVTLRRMTRRDSPFVAARRCVCPLLLGVALSMFLAHAANATICKYIDAEGATHYTNVPPEKGWRKVSCDVADDAPRRAPAASGARTATPTGFPRVEPETHKCRDEIRRMVLNDELASV